MVGCCSRQASARPVTVSGVLPESVASTRHTGTETPARRKVAWNSAERVCEARASRYSR